MPPSPQAPRFLDGPKLKAARSPRLPVRRPRYSAPWAWQASSITVMPCSRPSALNGLGSAAELDELALEGFHLGAADVISGLEDTDCGGQHVGFVGLACNADVGKLDLHSLVHGINVRTASRIEYHPWPEALACAGEAHVPPGPRRRSARAGRPPPSGWRPGS